MRRSVLILNLLLLVAIGLSCWQMNRQYRATLKLQRDFLAKPAVPPAPPILTLPPDPAQIQASAYLEVAASLPFSPDRNPTVIVEAAPPKPMPPLPAYHGMMNFGEGPRVILSAGGQAQRSYKVGDAIGEFKLVAVAQSGLVFEWDGKQVPAGYAELTRRAAESAPPPPQSAPAAPPQPSAAKAVTAIGSTAAVATVVPTGSSVIGDSVDVRGTRDCKTGDTTPEGTVVDGYRKTISPSPFGQMCRWVPVK